jgi:hypothetical protein
MLGCRISLLHNFRSSKGQYKLFTLPKAGSKDRRPVEDPKKHLKDIHGRLKNLLCGIEVPDYLKSGVKGKSHINNAKAHLGHDHCITMDLKGFYQTGRKTFLQYMFKSTFKMLEDIAWLLADIATINKNGPDSYFPTGSPLSQILIFWCYRQTFDDIDVLCKSKGITFSLYVDDMTFSSNRKIPKSFIAEIKRRIEYVKLSINDGKTKVYGANKAKIITGCAVTKNGLQV